MPPRQEDVVAFIPPVDAAKKRLGEQKDRLTSNLSRLMSQAGFIHSVEQGDPDKMVRKQLRNFINSQYSDRSRDEKKRIFDNHLFIAGHRHTDAWARYKNAFHQAISEGGLQFPEGGSKRLTPEQEKRADRAYTRRPESDVSYTRTPQQSLEKTIGELDLETTELAGMMLYSQSGRTDQDIARYLGKDPERAREIADAYEANITEKQFGYPDQFGPDYLKVPLELLGAREGAAMGAVEAAVLPLQDEAERRGYTPEAPAEPEFQSKRDAPWLGEMYEGAAAAVPDLLMNVVAPGAGGLGELARVAGPAVENFGKVLESQPRWPMPMQLGGLEPFASETVKGAGRLMQGAGALEDALSSSLEGVEAPQFSVSTQDVMDRVYDARKVIGAIRPDLDATIPKIPDALRSEARYSGVPLTKAKDWVLEDVGRMAKEAILPPGMTVRKRDPGVAKETFSAALEGAKNVIDPHARWEDTLRGRKGASRLYAKAAGAPDTGKLGTPEQEQQIESMKRQDIAIQDPATSQIVTESSLGLLPYSQGPVGLAGKALGKGSKVARQAIRKHAWLPSGAPGPTREIDDTLDWLSEGMTWGKEYRELSETMPEMASAMRAGAQKAQLGAPRMFARVEELLGAFPKEGTQESLDLFNARRFPDEFRKSYLLKYGDEGKEHLRRAEELADQYAEIQMELHLRADFKGKDGKLVETFRRENYVPQDLRDPNLAEGVGPTGKSLAEDFHDKFGWQKSMSHEGRVGAFSESYSQHDPTHALKDFTKQWRNKIGQGKRYSEPIAEMQEIKEVSKQYGSRVEMARPEIAKARIEVEAALKEIDSLKKKQAKLLSGAVKKTTRYEDSRDQRSLFDQQMRQSIDDATLIPPGDLGKQHRKALRRLEVSDEHGLRASAGELGDTTRRLQYAKLNAEKVGKRYIEAIANDKVLERKIAEMTARDGVKYVPLDLYDRYAVEAGKRGLASVGDAYRRFSGDIGTSTLRGEIELVPLPVAKRLDTLTRTLNASPKEALRSVTAVDKWFVGPLQTTQRVWRGTHTLLSLPYYLRNAFGAFGLSTVAMGTKALDPKLQGGAITAALASGDLFDDALRQTKWVTPAGVESTIGEIVDAAVKMRIIDMSDLRIAMGMRAKGPLDATAKAFEDMVFRGKLPGKAGNLDLGLGISKIAPANVNRVIDNYQHLVSFMGKLKDPKDFKSLYEAADFAARFGGTYSRLGKWEKGLLKDTLGFYAWYRYILPHSMREMMNNPQRYAAWNRALNYQVEKYANQAPVGGGAFSPWAQGHAQLAPGGIQPSTDENSRLWDADPDAFVLTNWESPTYMLTSLLAPWARGDNLTNFLGWGARGMAEMIIGRDLRTMDPIPTMFTVENGGFPVWSGDTGVGRAVWGMVDRPSRDYGNLINMFLDAGDIPGAIDLASRLRGGNASLSLDHLVSAVGSGLEYTLRQGGSDIEPGAMDLEPQTVGGMFDPDALPFGFNYRSSPTSTAYQQMGRASSSVPKKRR